MGFKERKGEGLGSLGEDGGEPKVHVCEYEQDVEWVAVDTHVGHLE